MMLNIWTVIVVASVVGFLLTWPAIVQPIVSRLVAGDWMFWLTPWLLGGWLFFLPLALTGHPFAFLWATQWFLPREFVDQWHGWPVGIGKWRDVGFFELASVILTAIYWSVTYGG